MEMRPRRNGIANEAAPMSEVRQRPIAMRICAKPFHDSVCASAGECGAYLECADGRGQMIHDHANGCAVRQSDLRARVHAGDVRHGSADARAPSAHGCAGARDAQ
jgi:hypothetical protein